jgi:hypothetical protein
VLSVVVIPLELAVDTSVECCHRLVCTSNLDLQIVRIPIIAVYFRIHALIDLLCRCVFPLLASSPDVVHFLFLQRHLVLNLSSLLNLEYIGAGFAEESEVHFSLFAQQNVGTSGAEHHSLFLF